jgi:cytosine/adenosine deaminase-related metal-dependent hydrolase
MIILTKVRGPLSCANGIFLFALLAGCASNSTISRSLPVDDDGQRTAPCEVAISPSGDTVLIGNLLSIDRRSVPGAVLIRDGKILDLGPTNTVLPKANNPSIFDCPNTYISPGFLNPHEHMSHSGGVPDPKLRPVYAHREQWQGKLGEGFYRVRGQETKDPAHLFWIELRHLLAGTTTVGGPGRVHGLVKNASARSNDSYDYPADMQIFPYGIASSEFYGLACPYGGRAPRQPELSPSFPTSEPYTPHIAEGINCTAELEGQFYLDYVSDNPGRRYSLLHGIGLSRSSLQRLDELDVTLVWSPRSNIALYNDTVDIPFAVQAGVRLGFGTDWSYSGSYNILEEFRCADRIDDNAWQDQLSPADLWIMATKNNAYALGLEDITGELAAGLAADIVIFERRSGDPHSDLTTASVFNVFATFVDGQLQSGFAPAFNSNQLPKNCSNRIEQHFVCADYDDYPFDHDELIRRNVDAVPLFSSDKQVDCGVHE